MDIKEILGIAVPALIQFLAIWSAFNLAMRRLPFETKKTEAEAGKLGAETVQVQGETLADAFDQIRELQQEIKEVRDELRRWRNYAGRLQKQIIDHYQGVPVPFDTPPSK